MLTLFIRNFLRILPLCFNIYNLQTIFISFHIWHKYNLMCTLVWLSSLNCLDLMIPSVIELRSMIVFEFTTLDAWYVRSINVHHPKAKIIIYILLYNAVHNCLYLYICKSLMSEVPIIITEHISSLFFKINVGQFSWRWQFNRLNPVATH